MKSKSFDLKQASQAEKDKTNKTFDFVGLYKSSAETKQFPEKRKLSDVPNNENVKTKLETPKLERSPNKNKRKQRNVSVELSQINMDGSSLNSSLGGSTPLNDSKTTSTPYAARKPQVNRVKSIMKTTLVNEDDLMDDSKETIISKPKKRNKSVSFMLDDNEEVVIKKTKSDDSLIKNKDSGNTKQKFSKDKVKNIKKLKKDRQSEKENKGSDVNIEQQIKQKLPKINKVNTPSDSQTNTEPDAQMQLENQNKKRKSKKTKKLKLDSKLQTESENAKTDQLVENKSKKNKKKKRTKPFTEEEGPVTKAHKKDVKPDLIAEDLENLSIGDNAHTLTNLLDEMTVVDKEKRKKNKLKQNKEHKKHVASNNDIPLENDDKKEKVKWKRRKWNKDRKGEINAEGLVTSVIVENLPISIMLTYKKLLADHFGKHGLINKIGYVW